VILTHAHWDHFAGLHDSAGDLTFPNAHYFMSKTEWGHCTADKQLESADENDPNPANIKKILLSLHESIYFVEGECEILPGVYTIPAPGHTIGQIAVLMTSKGEGLIHAADVTHHTFQIDHPDWSLAYDPLQQESRETRHKLVERAARENLLWMGYHFTFPPVGRVSKDINGYHWHPLAA
jgi:glyoxylase-like metal-dependent hydrolase (beta-lactamase superfamily II)